MNNISTISGNLHSMQWEAVKAEPRQTQHAAQEYSADSVEVNSTPYVEPVLIADEDVDAVLDETMGMITADPYAAMHMHSGLDASRVAALLA